MENNTININGITGEVTHSYTEPQTEQQIVIDYDFEVNKLIRQRYTASQEFAINRKFAFDRSNESEFLEYYNYVENCKQIVKELIISNN